MSLRDAIKQYDCDFDLPPTNADRKKYFGQNLIRMWEQEFNERCWRVPHYNNVSYHVLLGQMPNIRNIKIRIGKGWEDCRIHMILLQESGSGKGGGFSFMNDVSRQVGLNFHTVGSLTNSALIGSIKPTGNNGRTEIVPGALDPRYNDGDRVNILASNEASELIDTSGNYLDKTALLGLQKAMNRIHSADNVITKETGIGNQNISFNCTTSLYLTTFKPARLFQTMTKTGFLQRMVVVRNPISMRDKIKVGMKHVQQLGGPDNGSVDNMPNIVSAIRYIDKFYKGIDELAITPEAKNALANKIIPQIYVPLHDLDSLTMHETKKFTTRYQVMLYKYIWHHAISRLSRKVEIEDVAYAGKKFIPIYKRLLAFMENEFRPDSEERIRTKTERKDIYNVYNKYADKIEGKRPWVRMASIIDGLEKEWDVSREGAKQRLNRHIDMFKQARSRRNVPVLKIRKK